MDRVLIEQLKVDAIIGVYDWERDETQPLILDLWLESDFTQAFTSDDLSDALNYAEIAERVKSYCVESRFQLLEALAGGILTLLLENYATERVGVRIRKPKAIAPAIAVIECERARNATP